MPTSAPQAKPPGTPYKRPNPYRQGRAWRNYRQQYLAENPLCQLCLPRPVVATVVHHVECVIARPDLFLDPDNMMPLCHTHHEILHGRQKPRQDAPG